MSIGLFQAIEQHDLSQLSDALRAGADPNERDPGRRGWAPLHSAVDELEAGGPIAAIPLLLAHGAEADVWDSFHDVTPLLMATYRGSRAAARILLESGANPNVRSGEGDSPLRCAVERGDSEMASMLLSFGAGKSIDDYGGILGHTALGIAASRFDVRMIELLLNAGANPRSLDDGGRTARDHLPPREGCDPLIWDRVVELLGRLPSRADGA